MLERLRRLWRESEFAYDNLNFLETLRILLDKYNCPFNSVIMGDLPDIPELERDFIRAVNGEPLAYIVGKASFWREEYYVQEGVLIPRADSETIVEKAIEVIPENTHFVDVCTGSGCLGISVLRSRPDLKATLFDISPVSERVANRNIKELGVSDRCEFKHFDLFTDKLPDCSAVIMNPPYITAKEMTELPKNVQAEPSLALYGGEDGLDFYRFAADSEDFKNKVLIFEIGYLQGEALLNLFGKGKVYPDLCGNDRCFVVR